MSSCFATRSADATHPSSITIPSQHQPPTSHTLPSPFRHCLMSPVSLEDLLESKMSSIIFRLVGVRRTRVNVVDCTIFVGSTGTMGDVEMSTEDGCSWVDSVAEEFEHMWMGWVTEAPFCMRILSLTTWLHLGNRAKSRWTTEWTGVVGTVAKAFRSGGKIARTTSGVTAMTTWSNNFDSTAPVSSFFQDTFTLVPVFSTPVTVEQYLTFCPLASLSWTLFTPPSTV